MNFTELALLIILFQVTLLTINEVIKMWIDYEERRKEKK
jgi:hypothetical protein